MNVYTIRIASDKVSAVQSLTPGLPLSSARAIAQQWAQDLAGSKAPWSVVVYDSESRKVAVVK